MSREDFLDCIRCLPHKGVPSFIFDTSFGTGCAGYTVREVCGRMFDGIKSARSIVAGRKYLRHDAVPGSMISMDTRVFGAEVELFDDRPAMLTKPAFSNPGSLYDHSPDEIGCDTVDQIILSNNTVKDLDPEAIVAAYIPSPFLFSAILRGLEPLLMDLLSEKDYVSDLMNFSTECCIALSKRHIDETESECSVIPGAYDNVDLIGMEGLSDICIPSLRKIDDILSSDGRPVIFHPHGSLSDGIGTEALSEFLDIGFDCIYYGEGCDHRRMCQLCQGRSSVMGGVDTSTTIFLGNEKTVENDTESVLEATEGYDFIYSCSCSVDRNLDAGLLRKMMETVRSHCP